MVGKRYVFKLLDFRQKTQLRFFAKLIRDPGIEDKGFVEDTNTRPLQLEAFILSNRKRKMIKFVPTIDGFKNEKVFFSDTDSNYIKEIK